MLSPTRQRLLFLLILLVLPVSAGCDQQQPTADPAESEAPVSDLDALLEGAPDPSKLPDEPKADQDLPVAFDLVDTQSPVKSQGSRGVCSIFSTVALMEHLYIKEGTIAQPDFSEQFLQWSVKFEVGAFTTTGGSNATRNLEAIRRFGIVDEAADPYESFSWGTSQDERCTGDDRPTLCYTNGEPSESALAAARWKLPRSRWVSNKARNIKAFMVNNKTAVTAGMQFFYQSWNHGRSNLPTNKEYWSEGYVLPPNAEDIEQSGGDRRAGHSILLVGWDDDLEVPLVDAEGEVIEDAEGNPKTEKGFFLFKNSWGTRGFGIRNVHGAGYGWIAYSYIEEYANAVSADEPDLDLAETCDDGVDNTYDGLADCADPACADSPACAEPVTDFEKVAAAAIPDDDQAGVTSTIEVPTQGFVTAATVGVDITHSFRGDLEVALIAPSGDEAIVFENDGAMAADLVSSWTVDSLVGQPAAGTWTLRVRDLAAHDVGTLNVWTLHLEVSGEMPTESCGDNVDNDGNGLIDCADPACVEVAECAAVFGPWQGLSDTPVTIPDNDPAGVTTSIDIEGEGHAGGVSVLVDIAHTYVGDLTLTLVHPDGSRAVLRREEGGADDDIQALLTTDAFNGKTVAGTWSLEVVDSYQGDEGTLNSWLLEIAGLGGAP